MCEIEWIRDGEQPLALIVRRGYQPDSTKFLTPLDFKQQVGFIVYGRNDSIPPHVHRPLERSLVGTSEALLLWSGRAEVDLFSDERQWIATRELAAGDLLLLVSGGHGFRLLEDTIFLEIKQGPYIGLEEKERF